MESVEEEVGPSVVFVGFGTAAVGYAVADYYEGFGVAGGEYFDVGEEIPGVRVRLYLVGEIWIMRGTNEQHF